MEDIFSTMLSYYFKQMRDSWFEWIKIKSCNKCLTFWYWSNFSLNFRCTINLMTLIIEFQFLPMNTRTCTKYKCSSFSSRDKFLPHLFDLNIFMRHLEWNHNLNMSLRLNKFWKYLHIICSKMNSLVERGHCNDWFDEYISIFLSV
jgi:hypothetical protein